MVGSTMQVCLPLENVGIRMESLKGIHTIQKGQYYCFAINK